MWKDQIYCLALEKFTQIEEHAMLSMLIYLMHFPDARATFRLPLTQTYMHCHTRSSEKFYSTNMFLKHFISQKSIFNHPSVSQVLFAQRTAFCIAHL